jgi:hypothetical protein
MNIAHKWILTTFACIPFVIGQVGHAAPYYKWVDEQGTTHYTQAPPLQKNVSKVEINTPIPSDSATAIKNLSTQNKKNLKNEDSLAKVVDKARLDATADTERRKKNATQCQKLNDALALLKSGQRLRTSDANGDRSILTEDQKADKIQQNTDQIQKNCL